MLIDRDGLPRPEETRRRGISVRMAGPADREDLLGFLHEYLPNLDPEARHRWLYRDNPHGPALTWLAYPADGGGLVGMTSFFARRLWVDGRVLAGALGGDGYVVPDWRRHGVASALHRASRDAMPAHGVRVMFGTPTWKNRSPLSRAGARNVVVTQRYCRPLHPRAVKLGLVGLGLWDRVLRPFCPDLRLDLVRPGDARVDQAWRSFVADQGGRGIATVRDSTFYTWRFLASPAGRQKAFVVLRGSSVRGALAVQRAGRRLLILDLVASREALGDVLRAACAHAADADAVDIKVAAAHPMTRLLRRHGFFLRNAGSPLNILLPESSVPDSVFFDPKRWYFTWADSDMDVMD